MIDCDVHVPVPAVAELRPFLSEHWREVVAVAGYTRPGALATVYPAGAPTTGPAEPPVLPGDCERAILNCYYGIEIFRNRDFGAAMASAVNDWLASEWLERDARHSASLLVTTVGIEEAVAEIDRLGSHPGFVQVFLPARSQTPYGNRDFHPIYEAAQRHGLQVCLHFGGVPGTAPTPSGWPSYYIEEYVGMAQVFQTQVVSLIAEGVFERFPDLKVVLAESGFTWLPSLMWRLDKEWKGIRREIPWVKEPPSAYIRRHVRVTTQPLEMPEDPRFMRQVLDQIDCPELLLYASDHPHVHATAGEALLELLTPTERERVLRLNALDTYPAFAREGSPA
jgi:uncharacterized protein